MQAYITLLLREGVGEGLLCALFVYLECLHLVEVNCTRFRDYLAHAGWRGNCAHLFHVPVEGLLIALTEEGQQVFITTEQSVSQHVPQEAREELTAFHDVSGYHHLLRFVLFARRHNHIGISFCQICMKHCKFFVLSAHICL